MTGPVLLDTSVASLFHPKRAKDPLFALYSPLLAGTTVFVSFQTVAELFQWAEVNHWGVAARAALDVQIASFTVISPDLPLLRLWGTLMNDAAAVGRRLEATDAWIVATAIHHGLPLVTHDRDMVGLPLAGLTVVSQLKP